MRAVFCTNADESILWANKKNEWTKEATVAKDGEITKQPQNINCNNALLQQMQWIIRSETGI